MKTFRIYHPVAGMNHQYLQGVYEYYQVCQLESSNNLNEVYFNGQNGFSDEYTAIGTRSTSVGDIIVDVEEDKHYMVMGVGFQEIPSTVTHYKKPVEDDLKWLSLDEVVSASLPDDIIIDEEGELASFDYYTGIKVAKQRGLVQGTSLQEVRQGTHFIVTCGDVMFSVNSDEYPQVARRTLI